MHWSVTVGTHALVVSILVSLWPEVLSNGPKYAWKESPRDTWRQLVLALSVKTLCKLFLKLSAQHHPALIIQSVIVLHLGHCSVDWQACCRHEFLCLLIDWFLLLSSATYWLISFTLLSRLLTDFFYSPQPLIDWFLLLSSAAYWFLLLSSTTYWFLLLSSTTYWFLLLSSAAYWLISFTLLNRLLIDFFYSPQPTVGDGAGGSWPQVHQVDSALKIYCRGHG